MIMYEEDEYATKNSFKYYIPKMKPMAVVCIE